MLNAIECKNVSIRYITGDFKDIGFKEYILRKIKNNYSINEFWADKNISFKLKKGDMLGIIGANGAGKSTLLKAVSGIMVPTEGEILLNGTVIALLELGAGFDGDLTVKENTYLRGALLGYTRKFMDNKYKEIIEFAELQNFEDRPFKQLSSGMKSRLAFSIACLVDPDILILDEVLSVGDGAFRQKSGDKMKEILDGGVTGILVSHSVSQIRELCNKVLWLDHGNQIYFGSEVNKACDAYEEFLMNKGFSLNKDSIEQLSKKYNERVEERNRRELKYELSSDKQSITLVVTNKDMSCQYACYLYDSNKNVIEKIFYNSLGIFTFHPEKSGRYFFTIYERQKDGSRIMVNTDMIDWPRE